MSKKSDKPNDMFNNNPFADFMQMFQNNNYFSAMSDNMQNNVDMNSFVAMQRKNTEALTAMGQVVSEGFQSLLRNQSNSMQANASELIRIMKEAPNSIQNPEQHAAQQMQVTKTLLDKNLAEMREGLQMCNKMSLEVFDIMRNSLSEVCGEACKVSAKRKVA